MRGDCGLRAACAVLHDLSCPAPVQQQCGASAEQQDACAQNRQQRAVMRLLGFHADRAEPGRYAGGQIKSVACIKHLFLLRGRDIFIGFLDCHCVGVRLAADIKLRRIGDVPLLRDGFDRNDSFGRRDAFTLVKLHCIAVFFLAFRHERLQLR